jgi:hypothetical protein
LRNPRTAAELRHYLAHLEQLPGADDVRLALATYFIGHDRPQEAELEILQSLASGESASKAAASDLLAKLSAKNGKQADRQTPRWPQGHVDSQLAPSTTPPQPRERAGNLPNQGQPPPYRPLHIEQDFWPQAFSTHWFISNDGNEIVGRSRLGSDVFRMTVEMARQNRDVNYVRGARLGHLLYVMIGGQPLAIDSRQDHPSNDGDVLWPVQTQDGLARDPIRPHRGPISLQNRGTRAPLYHTAGRKRLNGASGAALGSLGPVTPRGVVFQDDDELKCVDPISGVTLWSRTDIPSGCELFGDDELVFAADVSSNDAYVVRLIDGQLLEKRERPRSEWLLTAGRNVANLTTPAAGRPNRIRLAVTDVLEQKTLYETEVPRESLY